MGKVFMMFLYVFHHLPRPVLLIWCFLDGLEIKRRKCWLVGPPRCTYLSWPNQSSNHSQESGGCFCIIGVDHMINSRQMSNHFKMSKSTWNPGLAVPARILPDLPWAQRQVEPLILVLRRSGELWIVREYATLLAHATTPGSIAEPPGTPYHKGYTPHDRPWCSRVPSGSSWCTSWVWTIDPPGHPPGIGFMELA